MAQTHFRVALKPIRGPHATGTAAHHAGRDIARHKRRGAVGFMAYNIGRDIERDGLDNIAKALEGKDRNVCESRMFAEGRETADIAEIARLANLLEELPQTECQVYCATIVRFLSGYNYYKWYSSINANIPRFSCQYFSWLVFCDFCRHC